MRWFLLALAVWVGTVQSQEARYDKTVAQEQEKAEQRKAEADKRPELVKKPKAKSEKKTGKKTDSKPDEKLNIDRQLAEYTRQLAVYTEDVSRFTLWLVIATIVIASIGVLQWWETRNTAKKELRAYMGIGGGQVYLLPGNTIRAEVEIKNFGRSPARNVKVGIDGDRRKPGETGAFDDPPWIPHKHYIAPTMYWTIGHEFLKLEDSDIQDIALDRKLVYIWGRVTYEDIYGKTRTLRFRFRNVVKSLDEHGKIVKWYYYPENEGNDETEGE